jgi:hypothetical protein
MLYRFEWRDDWEVGSHVKEYGDAYDEEPETCELVLLHVKLSCGHWEVVDSLGCIDDASDEYRRALEEDMLQKNEIPQLTARRRS